MLLHRLMPLAEAVAGFRASFVLLICAAAGTYAIQGKQSNAVIEPYTTDTTITANMHHD